MLLFGIQCKPMDHSMTTTAMLTITDTYLMAITSDTASNTSATAKRCRTTRESILESKRFRDNNTDAGCRSQSTADDGSTAHDVDADDDHRVASDDEFAEWETMSESRRQELDISNLVFNMSLSRVEIDWPDVSACVAADPPKAVKYEKFPPRVGDILFGYYLKESLSVGKRSAVFVGYKVAKSDDESNGSEVIVKVAIERGFDDLKQELHNYRKVKGCRSVGHHYDYIWWKDWQNQHYGIRWGLIVFEMFGPNLLSLMKRSIRRVMEPIESQFAIAVQMIDCIEDIHSKGFIHCSLRPENFVIESETKCSLKLIGLSDAKEFVTQRLDGTVEHIEDTSNYRFLPYGDPNFHSIGYHSGFCPSRRDDMESLGYCMIFMAKGSLPWMSPSDKNLSSPKTIRKIGKRMKETPLPDLCAGLPQNFLKYFDLISRYEFNEKPDYESLRQCFQSN